MKGKAEDARSGRGNLGVTNHQSTPTQKEAVAKYTVRNIESKSERNSGASRRRRVIPLWRKSNIKLEEGVGERYRYSGHGN